MCDTIKDNFQDMVTNLIPSKIQVLADQINEIKKSLKISFFCVYFDRMLESTNNIIFILNEKIGYLNNDLILSDGIQKSIQIINDALSSYINSLNSIKDPNQDKQFISKIQADINNYSQFVIIYASKIEEIFNKASDLTKDENTQLMLGIESALFNFSVSVYPSDKYPFYVSKFVEIYKSYNLISKINKPIQAFKSFSGTGKTFCIPLILLLRSLKEGLKAPFCILVEPTDDDVKCKESLFNNQILKYVTITTDQNELKDMINRFKQQPKDQKLVLAILSPIKLLSLMNSFNDNNQLYSCSRIFIDDVHQRSILLDVIIARIASLFLDKKVFSLSLNVILMSSSISSSILYPFRHSVDVCPLVCHYQYEVVEREPIVENSIRKIYNAIVPKETINVINEMSKRNSEIEEGHIVCFLPNISICKEIKRSIISLKTIEGSENKRRIVFIQSFPKQKENLEAFFDKLRKEMHFNEQLNEMKDTIYFIPLIFNGFEEDLQNKLSLNEFPDDLKIINKLIFSTSNGESFYFNNASVVIDSGLIDEYVFDKSACLTTSIIKQAPKESMNRRRGRLGKTMKGLYVPIMTNTEIPEEQIPSIERLDLINDILVLKNFGIDFEKMKNLPNKPNYDNVYFALKNLKYYEAIDKKTSKITELGKEILKFPFIPLYYATSIVYFRNTFQDNNDRNFAYFFASYISLVINMENILVQEEITEKLLSLFNEDSDLITYIDAFNELLTSGKIGEELQDLVESYGFSYSAFIKLKNYMQEIVDSIFPGKEVGEIIIKMNEFISHNDGMSSIIDSFIYEIECAYPNWAEVHYANLNYIIDNETRPAIAFKASNYLKLQSQKYSEIRLFSRPGWKGIMIPTECYCFNIKQDKNLGLITGHLIHKIKSMRRSEIISVECSNGALSPWFKVLIRSYFEKEDLNVVNLKIFNDDLVIDNKSLYFSNSGENLYISFIPKDENTKRKIIKGIDICIQLMPYTPRSIVVFQNLTQSLIEITSVGTDSYFTSFSNYCPGERLDKKKIDFCFKHIDELKKSETNIRICALFISENCQLSDFDQNNLYLINTKNHSMSLMNDSIDKQIILMKSEKFKTMNTYSLKNYEDINLHLYQFPSQFIHPALFYHKESYDSILNWFSKYCSYVHIKKVIGHRFLMKYSEILELQRHVSIEREKIQQEMNLKYVAIPISDQIYSKAFLEIREHPSWNYFDKFKVIIVSKEEEKEVNHFIESTREELENQNNYHNDDYSSIKAIGCCYVCDNPENPSLTHLPITIYNQDGTFYTKKMCRGCILSSLQFFTQSFFINGKINHEVLESIHSKPQGIPSVPSREIKKLRECWPQIPLGQLITVLINNDDELSSYVSAWLCSITEYAIRTQMKQIFTFCPDHPHKFYNVLGITGKRLMCGINGCKNTYCTFCGKWHTKDNKCNASLDQKECPRCQMITFKNGGCNHITCPCGCHWCYVCKSGFNTSSECYDHLNKAHGGYWS